MDITPLIKEGQKVIQSYGEGYLRINGQRYEGALFVTPDQVVSWEYSGSAADITNGNFEDLHQYLDDIDVLLLGCGKAMARIDRTIHEKLRAINVSLDVMDTAAACRTYNVLMAEGRRVAAALLQSGNALEAP